MTAIHATVEGEILIGCGDGKLIHYDKERTKSITDPSCVCSSGMEHGRIIKVQYDPPSKLLIIGFDQGQVHIKKCTQGLRNSLFGGTQWRECCCTLSSNQSLLALECFSSSKSGSEPVSPSNPPHLELWCGTTSHEIEVWNFSVVHSLTWNTETVNQIRKVFQVPVSNLSGIDKVSVKLMSRSDDDAQLAAVLATPETTIIAVVDVKKKQCLASIPFNKSGIYVDVVSYQLIRVKSLHVD